MSFMMHRPVENANVECSGKDGYRNENGVENATNGTLNMIDRMKRWADPRGCVRMHRLQTKEQKETSETIQEMSSLSLICQVISLANTFSTIMICVPKGTWWRFGRESSRLRTCESDKISSCSFDFADRLWWSIKSQSFRSHRSKEWILRREWLMLHWAGDFMLLVRVFIISRRSHGMTIWPWKVFFRFNDTPCSCRSQRADRSFRWDVDDWLTEIKWTLSHSICLLFLELVSYN